MPERLTVEEASAAYEGVMRNLAPTARGVCETCHGFIDPRYALCYACAHQPDHLDVVAAITYSVHLGQMHTALRNYKDGIGSAQRYAMIRLAAILWRFLDRHEACIAAAAATPGFDIATTVPSSTPQRDDRRGNLRTIMTWCSPIRDRVERILAATGDVPSGRAYDERRYRATRALDLTSVLLVDDTWTTGGHAQSAAFALREAGARRIGLAVIGRHVRPDHEITTGDLVSARLAALPTSFDWNTCVVHP